MSVLNAQGWLAPAAADQYIAALLELVGDRDPMAILRRTPTELAAVLQRIPSHQLRIAEAPGKWSAAIVFAHLADSELVGGFRLRMILAHDRPALMPYDQDRWAQRLGYDQADPGQSLTRFATLRGANLTLFETLGPAELAREGLHAERGPESVERMRRLYAGHDLAHVRQLERIARSLQ